MSNMTWGEFKRQVDEVAHDGMRISKMGDIFRPREADRLQVRDTEKGLTVSLPGENRAALPAT